MAVMSAIVDHNDYKKKVIWTYEKELRIVELCENNVVRMILGKKDKCGGQRAQTKYYNF